MSGKEILADTNILIYLLQGDNTLEEILLGKQLHISFISELELIGFHNASKDHEKKIESLLNDCFIIPLSHNIKSKYKTIRKSHKLKLADSVVAATALSLDMPLITADKQFKSIKALQLIQYER